jgi:DNA-binding XRE family transcriptional regulator
MMTPEHCRAARGWLGWTQQDLATRAGVSLSTVKMLERGGKLIPATANATQRAIEQAGIRLLTRPDGSAEGIAARTPD